MTAAPAIKKLGVALIAVALVTVSGAAGSPEFIDQPHCDLGLVDEYSSACQASPFSVDQPSNYDAPDGEAPADYAADEATQFRSDWYGTTYYMPSKLQGVAGAVSKIDVLTAINDGQTPTEYGNTAQDRLDNLYSEQVRRIAKVNRETTQMALEIYQGGKQQFAIDWCEGTPDELELVRQEQDLTTFDGTTVPVASLQLVDQNTSTAGSCATNASADRSRTIVPTGLSGTGSDLTITNTTGATKTLVAGTMYDNLMTRLQDQHTTDENTLETMVSTLFSEVTAGEYQITDLDIWEALVSAAQRYDDTGSYEAQALPAQGVRGFTDPAIIATVNASGEQFTGQLFGGNGDGFTYETNASYSPSVANIVTSDGVEFIGGGYQITELVRKSSGEQVSNMTAQTDLYGLHTADLGAQLNGTTELHDMATGASPFSGITGDITGSASQLVTAIWDLIQTGLDRLWTRLTGVIQV